LDKAVLTDLTEESDGHLLFHVGTLKDFAELLKGYERILEKMVRSTGRI
jgi:hypothetical protein